jgi:hypothetical protein
MRMLQWPFDRRAVLRGLLWLASSQSRFNSESCRSIHCLISLGVVFERKSPGSSIRHKSTSNPVDRPILVLSQDVFNERSGTVIAGAFTSQEPRAGFPLTLGTDRGEAPEAFMGENQPD